MKSRQTPFVAKGHNHFWILDRNSFGVCKCGATKQFPKEEIPKLEPHEITTMNNIAKLALHYPGSWCSGSCEIRFVDFTDRR
jgi:hypothetical protein